MKRTIIFSLAAVFALLLARGAHAASAPSNSSHAVVLMHPDTGSVLYEQNANERMLVASTTKVMTALIALEYCDPEEVVTVMDDCVRVEGSSMYLKAGGSYTVEQLVYGLMLVSGNDAALALAYHIGGGVEGFAALMNEKARSLGLENTNFENPHGLDSENHFSSAKDLAVIMSAAMENELFAEIVSTRSYNIGELTYVNHNKLLWKYEGTIGGKTGYTMAAGRSLISCAQRGDVWLVCVTISDPDDWEDHMALYDWAFSEYEYKTAVPAGQYAAIPVISGEYDEVGVAPASELKCFVPKETKLQIKVQMPRFVFAGVQAGEKAGSLTVYSDAGQIGEVSLLYTGNVDIAQGIKLTAWEKFRRGWRIANRYGPLGYSYGWI